LLIEELYLNTSQPGFLRWLKVDRWLAPLYAGDDR
jgi:hypothetical protein